MNACHYTFVQAHEMCSTNHELCVHCEHWVAMMCQCRFLCCNCPTLMGDGENGGVCVWEQGVYGKCLCLLSVLLGIIKCSKNSFN